MKVKLDENIPVSLAEALASLGHDVQTVIGQGLTGRANAEIWRHCQLEDRLLMTQDLGRKGKQSSRMNGLGGDD